MFKDFSFIIKIKKYIQNSKTFKKYGILSTEKDHNFIFKYGSTSNWFRYLIFRKTSVDKAVAHFKM